MKAAGMLGGGYTIVEVMIFLAVSGAMFVMAALFINGKQAQAEFTRSVGNLGSLLQQVTDNVINGYYPSQENFVCTRGASSLSFADPSFVSGTGQRGTNGDCVYLGEVVQLGVAGSGGEGYAIIPVVGSRLNDDQKEVTTFAEAFPTPLTNDKTNPKHVDTVQQGTLGFGLHVTKMGVVTQGSPVFTPISAYGVFTTFGDYGGGDLLSSGSTDIRFTTVPGMDYTTTGGYINGYPTEGSASAASTKIMSITNSNVLTDTQSIVICLKSGYDKPASVALGMQQGHLSVQPDTGEGVNSECTS